SSTTTATAVGASRWRSASVTSTAPAREAAAWAPWRASDRKLMSAGPADARLASRSIRRPCAGPSTRPSTCLASSASPTGSGRGRIACPVVLPAALAPERAQHLLCDIDARAHGDRLLQDEVVALLLGDVLDRPVRLLDHLGELLVAPLVEVLAELALLALEVLLEIGILAQQPHAIRLAQHGVVPLDPLPHGLVLGRDVQQLLLSAA